MAQVFIPSQWRDLTGGMAQVELPGATLRQIVSALDEHFPGIRERLCAGDEISPGLAVSIDGAINARGMTAQVKPGSEIHFLPAIGGG
jgi:molybdopterin synthase sulfur carrier subunit